MKRHQTRYEVNWPVVVFGNGLEAILVDYRVVNCKEGGEMVELVLRPTVDLVLHYGLEDLDYFDFQRGLIKKRYPKSMFFVLNPSLSCGRYLVWCGFDGERVDLDGGVDDLIGRVSSLEKVIGSLKKENAYLHSLLRKKTSQISKLEDEELKRFNKISSNSKNNLMLEPYLGGGEQ